MTTQISVAIACLPPIIREDFVAKLMRDKKINHRIKIICSTPYDASKCSPKIYLQNFYSHVANSLRESDLQKQRKRNDTLLGVNLVVLYLNIARVSTSDIFHKFGIESLVCPIKMPEEICLDTPNHRRIAVNYLSKNAHRAIRHADALLDVIADHVRGKDSRTPLLLPVKNFGKSFRRILDAVREASSDVSEDKERFRIRIREISKSLPKSQHGYRNESGIVFKGQRKAGSRHGLSPNWSSHGHELSCILRGRLRFGVFYDPKFHYDCNILKNTNRIFPSCHGETSIPRSRKHVNIAPNDNIR